MSRVLDILSKHLKYDMLVKYILDNLVWYILVVILIIFYTRIRKTLYAIFSRINKRIFKEEGVYSFFNSVTKFIINVVLIIIILDLIGIDFNGIMAVLGAMSLVLGFAFKETFANIFSGLVILTFKPFKVDDIIEYKEYIGIVKKIEILYTTIINFQNEYIIVPNSGLTSNEIRNINKSNNRRLDLVVGISYDSNIELAKKIIEETIKEREEDLFIAENPPIIGVGNFADSSINIEIKAYVQPNMYLNAKYYILESLKRKFDENNIEIPYNKLDLYIKDGEIK